MESNGIKKKLTVGPNGQMEEVTTFQGVEKLPVLKGTAMSGTILVTKLTDKEVTLPSGIVLPGSGEPKFAIVAVAADVKQVQVGDIVALQFTHGQIPLQFIEGVPVSVVYPGTISWIYQEKLV